MQSFRFIGLGIASSNAISISNVGTKFSFSFENSLNVDSKGRIWTVNGSGINRSNVNAYEGSYAMNTPTANAGHISLNDSTMISGTGDFTYDYWACPTTLTQSELEFVDYRRNGTDIGGIALIMVNNAFRLWNYNDKYFLSIANFFTEANVWVRITVVRISGVIYVYRNGTLAGQANYARNLTSPFRSVGGRFTQLTNSWYSFTGYMDSFTHDPVKALVNGNFDPNMKL